MKHALSLIVTLMLFALYWLPVYAMYEKDGAPEWSFFYLPLVIMSIFWGGVLVKVYFL